jgi:hypothetical protein
MASPRRYQQTDFPCVLFALYLILRGKGSLFSGANYIKRSDFQGIVSPTGTGVLPNCTRTFSLTVFSSAWGMFPQSISTPLPYFNPSITMKLTMTPLNAFSDSHPGDLRLHHSTGLCKYPRSPCGRGLDLHNYATVPVLLKVTQSGKQNRK